MAANAAAWEKAMAGVISSFQDAHPLPETTVRIGDRELRAQVATSREEKAIGMTGRDFGDFEALLFVEPTETWATFAGLDDRALTLAFFDSAGVLLEQLELEPGQTFRPERPFRYAVELPAGSSVDGVLQLDP